jgi:hypothetical protein
VAGFVRRDGKEGYLEVNFVKVLFYTPYNGIPTTDTLHYSA